MHEVPVEGVSFVTNQRGRRIAVQLDLEKHGELWEEIYLSLLAEKRLKEPSVSYSSARKRIARKRKPTR